MNILFLNAGRRCELIQAFKNVLSHFPGGGLVFGSDITPLAPALSFVDKKIIFPHCSSEDFKPNLVAFCLENEIELIIPTIDPDLLALNVIREELCAELPNTKVLLPNDHVVNVASNKVKTKEVLSELGFRTPKSIDVGNRDIDFPVFVKPTSGSAGIGARKVSNHEELLGYLETLDEPIVEEYVEGPEFTVDVFCNNESKALMAVPRKRLAARGGEVTKGVVQRNEKLEALASDIADKLGCDSPVTIQFIEDGNDYVPIEINARLGGGLPLTIAAGANWPLWILNMVRDKPFESDHKITDRLMMSRYDQSVFLNLNVFDKPKPNLSSVKAIVLDMDDTLYPERSFVFSGYREVANHCLREFGVFIEDELYRRFEAGERGDLFSTVLKSKGVKLEEQEVLELVRIYREHEPKIYPYADVDLLKELHGEGYHLALVSDGWQNVQKKKWKALKLDEYFIHKIFTDALGKQFWKPHPRAFELVSQWLELPFSEMVYIADNPAKDFIAANKLGMHSIRINRYGSVHGNLHYGGAETEPEYEISSFTELKSMLNYGS